MIKLFKQLKQNSGLTLMETLVALAIFSFVIATLLQLFPINLASARYSRNKTIASYLAQAEMEETLSNNYTAIDLGTTTLATLSSYHPDFAKFSSIINVALVDGNLNLITNGSDVGLKRINITVSWTDFGVTKSYTINTLISNL